MKRRNFSVPKFTADFYRFFLTICNTFSTTCHETSIDNEEDVKFGFVLEITYELTSRTGVFILKT